MHRECEVVVICNHDPYGRTPPGECLGCQLDEMRRQRDEALGRGLAGGLQAALPVVKMMGDAVTTLRQECSDLELESRVHDWDRIMDCADLLDLPTGQDGPDFIHAAIVKLIEERGQAQRDARFLADYADGYISDSYDWDQVALKYLEE